jgi:hypothetical protein
MLKKSIKIYMTLILFAVLLLVQSCQAWYIKYGIVDEQALKSLDSVPKLVNAIENQEIEALAALQAMGTKAVQAEEALVASLTKPLDFSPQAFDIESQMEFKAAAAQALVQIANNSKSEDLVFSFVDQLAHSAVNFKHNLEKDWIEALGYECWPTRLTAIRVLRLTGSETTIVAEAIAAALGDSSKDVRMEALLALRELEVATQEVVDALNKLAENKEEDHSVKQVAFETARKLRFKLLANKSSKKTKPPLSPPVDIKEKTPAIVVAVFEIQDKTKLFSPETINQLSDFLEAKLTDVADFRVVPRQQLKKRMNAIKKESYKNCYDEDCHIELGREVSAQKSLATKLLKIGDKCSVMSVLYDLKTQTSEKSSSAELECSESALMDGIKAIANHLK